MAERIVYWGQSADNELDDIEDARRDEEERKTPAMCYCDIKTLMSTGHDADCPDKK